MTDPPGCLPNPPSPDEAPIAYMERTRTYYQALGYGPAYRWAHFAEVPFARLTKPLARCRVGLVTTAALYRPEAGEQGPGAPYNAAAKFYRVYSASVDGEPETRIAHVAYDRTHTSAEDQATWFPLAALKRAAAGGRIGGVASRFHGLPTNRSQATTMQTDAPELLSRLREDEADAVLLVANCPVCHQAVALSARYLEAAGLPTVIMGCAKDIVEHAGVPRFLFSDFPLGNAAGRPRDRASQDTTLRLALDLLEQATTPRTTVQSPLRWGTDSSWKRDYCDAAHLSQEDIARLRREFESGKETARLRRSQDRPPGATAPG